MDTERALLRSLALPAALLALTAAWVVNAQPADAAAAVGRAVPAAAVVAAPTRLAQATGTEPRELQPRYEPAAPEPHSDYNSSYVFGLTRGVADSTMSPAAKAPLFVLTVPLDLVFLPFAVIGGFFG